MQKLTPCLWFDTEGEAAAEFYTSVFPNSRILDVSRYGEAGPRPAGTVMTVTFELDGQRFVALNGGESDPETSQRVMRAMLQMKKIQIDELERAAAAPA